MFQAAIQCINNNNKQMEINLTGQNDAFLRPFKTTHLKMTT